MSSQSKFGQPDSISEPGDDNALVGAVERYRVMVAAGESVDVSSYVMHYPELGSELRDCLEALEMVAKAAPRMASETTEEPMPAVSIQAIGDYRIIREIGRGGMGVVYEAEQLSLGRSVALKVLPYAAMMDRKAITRFKNEARAAATLDHPHIVPIFGFGNDRGIYYYAMSLIQGMTLAELIGELRRDITESGESAGRLSVEAVVDQLERSRKSCEAGNRAPTVNSGPQTKADEVSSGRESTHHDVVAAISTHHSRFDRSFSNSIARLGAQAATALEHAHQHGIVHRDIKPGNLMIDTDTRLWVTDFGLARIESDPGMTMTGDLVGTLRYMAPEQALAQRVVVDPRADIYSLGASLYELLALRPPLDGSSREALLKQIAFEEPKPLRQINRAVPEDLQTIIQKALSKDADDRYATAQEMAHDLLAFVDDEPIKARPLSIAQRTTRWAAKQKRLLAAIAGVLILAVIGLLISNAMLKQQRDVTQVALALQRQASEKAARQTRLAEANARMARDTVDQYLTTVSEVQLLNTESMQPLRKELLQLALSYYQELTKQQPQDPTLTAEYAAAFRRVGKIEKLLGDTSAAIQAYESELSLRETLAERTPNSPDNLEELAMANTLIAAIYGDLNDARNRNKYAQQAMVTLQKIAVIQPDRVSPNLAKVYNNVSRMLSSMEESLEYRHKGMQLLESLLEKYPDDETYRFDLAYSLATGPVFFAPILLGSTASGGQKVAACLKNEQRAIDILRRLVKEEPSVLEYQRSLGIAYANLAVTLDGIGQTDQAIDATCNAIDILERLVERNPDVCAYRLNLSSQFSKLFVYYQNREQWEEALASIERAADILDEACNRFSNDEECFHELSVVYQRLGMSLLMLGRNDQATDPFKKQIQLCKQRPDAEKSVLGRMGAAYYHLGMYAESRSAFETILKSRDETTPTIRGGMRWWYLALLLAQAGEHEKSRSCFDALVEETKRHPGALTEVVRFLRSEIARLLGVPDPAEDEPKPSIANALYERDTGPRVAIDAAHFNLHSLASSHLSYRHLYRDLGEILAADGYRVFSFCSTLNSESLADVNVLVMANPRLFDVGVLWKQKESNPSESEAVVEWVRNGGSLLLIADRGLCVSAIEELTASVGIEMTDDHVTSGADGKRRRVAFERANGQLAIHPIMSGRSNSEKVNRVVTFNDFAFRASHEYQPLLILEEGAAVSPGRDKQGQDVSGWLQGAAGEIGQGRVVVLAEADIFSTKGNSESSRVGLNAEGAEDHQQFLLNIVHWLSGAI